MAVLNPEYMGRLFNDPMGQQVLGGAILSLGSGLMTMRTMIKKSLS
jgi:Flp pilus assembly protein TadB